jgi:hypothetical protein
LRRLRKTRLPRTIAKRDEASLLVASIRVLCPACLDELDCAFHDDLSNSLLMSVI